MAKRKWRKKGTTTPAPQPEAKRAPVMRPPVNTPERPKAVRPTAERMAKGAFRVPVGPGRQEMPAIDEAFDCIAALHRAGLINAAQEAAARDWQELKARVRAELGLSQGRSCLDISPVGHDSDDGDPEVMERWREVEERLGWVKTGMLDWVCCMGRKPANMQLLRDALDAFAAC